MVSFFPSKHDLLCELVKWHLQFKKMNMIQNYLAQDVISHHIQWITMVHTFFSY